MTGGGLSPGAETINYLPDEETTDTYVLRHESEGFQFTDNLDEWDRDEVEVLAKLTKRKAAMTKLMLDTLLI